MKEWDLPSARGIADVRKESRRSGVFRGFVPTQGALLVVRRRSHHETYANCCSR